MLLFVKQVFCDDATSPNLNWKNRMSQPFNGQISLCLANVFEQILFMSQIYVKLKHAVI